MNTVIRVAVVDNHLAFREGVVHALGGSSDMAVVGTGASAEDAMLIGLETAPDVLLLDMNMPGNCTTTVGMLSYEVPNVRALILTVMADAQKICDVLEMGARGYLLKGIGGTELLHAIRVVHGGNRYVTPALAVYLVRHFERLPSGRGLPDYLAVLNEPERRILSLIAEGLSNKEIGVRLVLGTQTISHYINSALHKLGVRNKIESAPRRALQEWRDQHDVWSP